MTYKEILKLLEAGYTRDEINTMHEEEINQPAQAAPVPAAQAAPVPAAQAAPVPAAQAAPVPAAQAAPVPAAQAAPVPAAPAPAAHAPAAHEQPGLNAQSAIAALLGRMDQKLTELQAANILAMQQPGGDNKEKTPEDILGELMRPEPRK